MYISNLTILYYRFRYRSEKEKKRLDEAGVGESVINAAVSEFILEIIVKHGKPAERLCNKGKTFNYFFSKPCQKYQNMVCYLPYVTYGT